MKLKVTRNTVFFTKLSMAVAYRVTIEHDNKIYRLFEDIDEITYFDTLYPEFENNENNPYVIVSVIESKDFDEETYFRVKIEEETYWIVDRTKKDTNEDEDYEDD